MILGKLTIENFSVYGEAQSINLAPTDSAHPIVLVGGLNGAGKTSILTAVRVALFGKRIVQLDASLPAYPKFLLGLINTQQKGETSVELSFDTYLHGKKDSYTIKRSWKCNSVGKIVEKFNASKNGKHDKVISSTWEEFIDAFIPVSIANLFFFDGEAVAEMANKDGAKNLLRTGIESLLGINLLSRLQDDLADLITKKTKTKKDSKWKEELEIVNAALRGFERDIKQHISERDSHKAKLQSLKEKLINADGHLKENGADLFIHRKEIEATMVASEKELENKTNELVELAAGTLPLSLVQSLLRDIQEQDIVESDAIRAKAVLGILEERDCAALDLIKREAPEAASKLSALFVDDRKKRAEAAKSEPYLHLSNEGREALNNLSQQISYEQGIAASQVDSYLDHKERLHVAKKQLSMVPPEEIVVEAIKQREDILAAINNTEYLISTSERRLEECDGRLKFRKAEKDRILKRIGEDNAEGAIEERVVHYAEVARERVGLFSGAVLNRATGHLEELILECLSLLLRKKDFVSSLSIDKDDYTLNIFTRNRVPVQLERLSAGERQLVIIAILWGLGRASGRPLPIIVDTPLGRLDSIHREHLAGAYFPAVSHQTILLSTDTEIVGETMDILKDFVGGAYTLDHDVKQQQTRIIPGYFSE